jgi:hypothetical protein
MIRPRMMCFRFFSLLLIAFLISCSTYGQAPAGTGTPLVSNSTTLDGSQTINPGDTLQIVFTTLPSPVCSGGPCDTLLFDIRFTSNPGTPISAGLYNATVNLGTFQTTVACLQAGTCASLAPSFVASGSLYGFNAPVVDFTSILNGTINGVLNLTVTAPTTVDLNPVNTRIFVAHATASGVINGGYLRQVTSMTLTPLKKGRGQVTSQ